MNVVGRNRINIDRSIFGWKEFQITVGLFGPSVFRKRGSYEISLREANNIFIIIRNYVQM